MGEYRGPDLSIPDNFQAIDPSKRYFCILGTGRNGEDKYRLRLAHGVLAIPSGESFEDTYRSWDAMYKKFMVARALLEYEDPILGKYDDPRRDPTRSRARFLLDDFIPESFYIDFDPQRPERGGFTQEQRQQVRGLQAELRLMLLDKGILSPEEPHAKEAMQIVIESDQELQRIFNDTQDPVLLGTMIFAKRGLRISDPEKRRLLRDSYIRSCIRDDLGMLKVYKVPPRDAIEDVQGQLDSVPNSVFDSARGEREILWDIIKDYFINKIFHLFRDYSEEEAFAKLQTLVQHQLTGGKQDFLQHIYDELREAQALTIPSIFASEVTGWNGEPSSFPLFRQKYLAWFFRGKRRLLLNGDTGATKTACSFLAMETVNGEGKRGAQRVIVIGPAKARDTWVAQAKKHFVQNGQEPKVFAVTSENQLKNPPPEFFTANYVYVSSALLANIQGKEELRSRLVPIHMDIVKNPTRNRMVDGIIIDEAHTFRNEETKASQELQLLVARASETYATCMKTAINDTLSQTLPIIALTATPISNSLQDFDAILGILYPKRFAMPGTKTSDSRDIFSRHALRTPGIARAILFGERLMMQWSPQDLFGDRIPPLEYQRHIQELSPHERVIYEFLYDLPALALGKMGYLIEFLLNPELTRYDGIGKKWFSVSSEMLDPHRLQNRFMAYYVFWKEWKKTIPEQLHQPFSQDWIVAYGRLYESEMQNQLQDGYTVKSFLLSCFFNPHLQNGIQTLASQIKQHNRELQQDWYAPEFPSTKYRAAAELIEAQIKEAQSQGKVPRICIVSPFRAEAITRDFTLDDDNGQSKEGRRQAGKLGNSLSFVEYLKMHFEDQDSIIISKADGNQDFDVRQEICEEWRKDDEKIRILVVSQDAVNESINMSITSNNHVNTIYMNFLSWDDTPSTMKQMAGRVLRPELATGARFYILETNESLESGLRIHNLRKQTTIRLTLEGGVNLTDEEQERLTASKNSDSKTIFDQQKRSTSLETSTWAAATRFIASYQGVGESSLAHTFSLQERNTSLARQFIESFYDEGRDEYKRLGQNARLLAALTRDELETMSERTGKILSVGFGTGLYPRMLRQAGVTDFIVGIDVNPEAASFVNEHHPEVTNGGSNGLLLAGGASHLGSLLKGHSVNGIPLMDGSFDIVEASFVLDLTKRPSDETEVPLQDQERVKILAQMSNALAFDTGRMILTLPKRSLDRKTLEDFVSVLENHFGLEVLEQTGQVFAQDDAIRDGGNEIGWIITARKKRMVKLENLDPAKLRLLTDAVEYTSTPGTNGKRRTPPEEKRERTVDTDPLMSATHFMVYNPLTATQITIDATSDMLLLPIVRRSHNTSPDTQTYTQKPNGHMPEGLEYVKIDAIPRVTPDEYQPVKNGGQKIPPSAIEQDAYSQQTHRVKTPGLELYRTMLETIGRKPGLQELAEDHNLFLSELAERILATIISERKLGLPSTWTIDQLKYIQQSIFYELKPNKLTVYKIVEIARIREREVERR